MKKLTLLFLILNFSCEKVVEIDLDFNEKSHISKINIQPR